MPKNTKGGKKHKSKKNTVTKSRKLEDIAKNFSNNTCQSYGQIIKVSGNRRFKVRCQIINQPTELREMTCRITGSCRKFVKMNDYVLLDVFDFNHNQAQIIEVYSPEEIEALKRNKLWDYPSVTENAEQIEKEIRFGDPALSMPDSDSETEQEQEYSNDDEDSEDDIDLI